MFSVFWMSLLDIDYDRLLNKCCFQITGRSSLGFTPKYSNVLYSVHHATWFSISFIPLFDVDVSISVPTESCCNGKM